MTGECAPCDGLLIPKSNAVQCLQCMEADLPECQEERMLDHERHVVDMNFVKAQRDAAQQRAERLSDLLDDATDIDFYEHPLFWGSLGAVLGAGLAVLIVHAVK